jgi:hypothetical protein
LHNVHNPPSPRTLYFYGSPCPNTLTISGSVPFALRIHKGRISSQRFSLYLRFPPGTASDIGLLLTTLLSQYSNIIILVLKSSCSKNPERICELRNKKPAYCCRYGKLKSQEFYDDIAGHSLQSIKNAVYGGHVCSSVYLLVIQ